jgi:hypothetical protein
VHSLPVFVTSVTQLNRVSVQKLQLECLAWAVGCVSDGVGLVELLHSLDRIHRPIRTRLLKIKSINNIMHS